MLPRESTDPLSLFKKKLPLQIGSFLSFKGVWFGRPSVAMSRSTTDLARAWEGDDDVRAKGRKHQAVPRNIDVFSFEQLLINTEGCQHTYTHGAWSVPRSRFKGIA